VAKPVLNLTPDGRSCYPWLLRNAKDLEAFQAAARPEDYFFQEWISGESVYLLFHLGRHTPNVRFSQRNLAQQPGGKSIVLAEAAEFHLTPLAEEWEETLRLAGFYGLAMIELRISASGEAVLIEANPRLWGPLQLAVDYCPALLETYFDDTLGPVSHRRQNVSARRDASYLWLGGARQTWRAGGELTWHIPRPHHPRSTILRQLPSDVYLRRDTFRWFLRE
jgi:hypothetical protein